LGWGIIDLFFGGLPVGFLITIGGGVGAGPESGILSYLISTLAIF
jgi:hypothetical protein